MDLKEFQKRSCKVLRNMSLSVVVIQVNLTVANNNNNQVCGNGTVEAEQTNNKMTQREEEEVEELY